jgi:invasion protein IalB
MKNSMKLAASLAFMLAISVSAIAQGQQRPAPPPVRPVQPPAHPSAAAPNGDAPQRTTATYGDWVVQCVENGSPPSERVCDMAQVTQLQGKNLPFSRVAVARPEKGQPVKLIVQVPVNASFGTQVHIQTSDQDAGVIAPFANCNPNGCFAEFDLKEDVLKKLREATGMGKFSFADAGGHDVAVPISFNGFALAFDALAKQ